MEPNFRNYVVRRSSESLSPTPVAAAGRFRSQMPTAVCDLNLASSVDLFREHGVKNCIVRSCEGGVKDTVSVPCEEVM